jgi:hypothetical protein
MRATWQQQKRLARAAATLARPPAAAVTAALTNTLS